MNERQVKWASQHDWFECAYLNTLGTWTVCVHPWYCMTDFNGNQEPVEYTDIQELRAWAGY